MLKMFVMTHKETFIPEIECYFPLLVGACNKCELKKIYTITDDTGENISIKNLHYCELTGLYWLWKNVHTDYIGVCHYRRYFTRARMYSKKTKYYLREKDIEKILKNYDMIVPERRKCDNTIPNIVRVAPNIKDLIEIKDALSAVCPEYVEDYDAFLKQNSFYLYNMMITTKTLFDEYCEWLFPVLEYIEEHHDMTTESRYRQRLYGFLAERLLFVWLHHNVPCERIKEMKVINTDESSFRMLLHNLKNKYREYKYILNRRR